MAVKKSLSSRRHDSWHETAANVLTIESAAVAALVQSLDERFMQAVECIVNTGGKIICSGVGKSGHIAGKIAATFSSTGTPAFFMHASEAGHGDLGMIGDNDTVLLISYSGESAELLEIIPALKRMQVTLIAIVSSDTSSLAQAVDITLSAAVAQEACPHNLAPTASTTATLALGDALAMTVLTARGFSADDFARTHPSGKLGRRLLLRVSDIMRYGDDIPRVSVKATLMDALLEMTEKRMGMTLILAETGQLAGIITDGDLRRGFSRLDNIQEQGAQALMTAQPVCVAAGMLAAEALQLMKEKSLNHLVVTDRKGELSGVLSFHDLLRHKIL